MPRILITNPPAFQTDLKKLIESYRLGDTQRRVSEIMTAIREEPAWKAMRTIDKVLETHGVEYLYLNDADDRSGPPDYLYANTGDTYDETVIWDRENNRFFVADWGTLVEEAERGKRGPHHRRYARPHSPARVSIRTSRGSVHRVKPWVSLTDAPGLADQPELLTQFVEMTAESMEARDSRDAEIDRGVVKAAEEYDLALWYALQELVGQSRDHVLAVQLWNAEGPYLVLMTLRGEGVGIWDGRWDEFYSKERLEQVQEFLEKKLRKFSDGTGAGILEEAFMVAAEKSTTIPENR